MPRRHAQATAWCAAEEDLEAAPDRQRGAATVFDLR